MQRRGRSEPPAARWEAAQRVAARGAARWEQQRMADLANGNCGGYDKAAGKGMKGGDGKGKGGKGQGPCWTCGGPHFQSECPQHTGKGAYSVGQFSDGQWMQAEGAGAVKYFGALKTVVSTTEDAAQEPTDTPHKPQVRWAGGSRASTPVGGKRQAQWNDQETQD